MVRALDRATGQPLWSTPAGSGSGQYFFHGDPFITSDVIVIGGDATSGGSIHGLDRASGRMRWKVAAGHGVSGRIVGSGARAFAATPEAVVSLDVGSGAVRWSRPLEVPSFEGPATDGNQVFVGTADGFLYALNADSGEQNWRTPLGAAASTSVTATQAAVYVGAQNGTLYRVDPRNGAVLSSVKLDEKLRPRSVPVVIGDAILVLLTDESVDYRSLVSLDLKLERVRWRQTASQNWGTSRAFVWNNTVVLGTPTGEINAYSTADGSMVWSSSVNGYVRSIGGSDDTLYVSTRQGTLYAISR